MSRLPRALQVGLAVVAGLVAGLVWLAASNDEETICPSDPIEVRADITPDAHVFGQQVVATVEALVDSALIDPASVRVEPEFAPYELAGPRTVERDMSDGAALVTFRFPLRCLQEGCDTSGARGVAEFETGRVTYHFRGTSGDAFAALDWPAFEVASRVSADDVERIRWRAAETTLPEVSYRVDPTRLAVFLLAAAAVLAAGAAVLASRMWRAGPLEAAAIERPEPQATRLERALALAREASLDGDLPRRRRALERVARELVAVNRHDLAVEARMLAWSPEGSTGEEIESLARRARDGAA